MSGHAAVEARVYRVGLAISSREVEAVVFDLPGCASFGRDAVSVVVTLPVVIAEHLAWLDQHGDVTRDAFPFEVEVIETVDVAALADVADGEFCFDDDYQASTRDDIETAIRRMAYARKDLLDSVRHLPNAVLDSAPPSASVRQDEWSPGVRSIRAILAHIAGADGYYAANIGAQAMADVSRGDADDLFGQRLRVVERLRNLQEEDLVAHWHKRQTWQRTGFEQWTVRKALRRLIAHERFHAKEIEQSLAWLLLGAPELAAAPAPRVDAKVTS